MPTQRAILMLLQRLTADPAEWSLGDLSERAGWSPAHLHRAFRRTVGETPKQYQRRLRLYGAAIALVSQPTPIARIASQHGFASHAAFTRAFRAQLGSSPTEYRRAHARVTPAQGARLVALARCVGLHHLPRTSLEATMAVDVTLEQRSPVPALIIRRRVAPSEVGGVLQECLPKVFALCARRGLPPAGAPFARYLEVGRGLLTLECGMPLASPAEGEGEVESVTLPGGDVAVAIHRGPYETVHETHALVERWIEATGRASGGPPWEAYLTDPADHPDPADWQTEVCWPVADSAQR